MQRKVNTVYADGQGKSDDAEFYFALAKDFIGDVDAKPFKVEKYFMMA